MEHDAKSAAGHVLAVQILSACAVGGHLLSLASVALNVAVGAAGLSTGPPAESEAIGFYGTFLCIGVLSLVGIGWAPINVWALHAKKPWARRSAIAYWAILILTCCGAPFGAYAIYALMRPDVRALLDATEPRSGW